MIINHNITALNTYRQLNVNSNAQAKSMAKLSSGLRINSAADDAAGLSISEKMKGQIRGLDQASRNAQDGISMVQTAEGALSETTDILQRMRELATQASNDTNTTDDRGQIQKEMNQLTSEVNRIGNTTEFNTKKLLNGGDVKSTQNIVATTSVGKAGSTLPATGVISAVTTKTAYVPAGTTGGTAATTIASATDMTAVVGNTATAEAQISGTFSGASNETLTLTKTASGWSVDGSTDALTDAAVTGGTTSFTYKGMTIDVANASADAASGDTWTQSLTATVAGTPTSAQAQVDKFTLSTNVGSGDKVTINGVDFTAVASGATGNQFNIGADANASATNLATAISAASGTTNVTASNAGAGVIELTQTAGNESATAATASITGKSTSVAGAYNFDVKSPLKAGDSVQVDNQTISVYKTQAEVDAANTASAGSAMLEGTSAADQATKLKTAITANTTLNTNYTASGTGNNVVLTQNAGQESATAPTVTTTQAAGSGFTAQLQVGANTNQTFSVDVNDMRSAALKISGGSTGTVTASNGKTASFVATANVTNGTDNNNTEFSLDVSTSDKATAAISVLDDAINTVSSERSKLGAFSNRLDHTINNLNTSSQNITDAQSRVTDVDMAKEMMNQTKSSVLAQAAQAMLAQANQQPQQVLQLLR